MYEEKESEKEYIYVHAYVIYVCVAHITESLCCVYNTVNPLYFNLKNNKIKCNLKKVTFPWLNALCSFPAPKSRLLIKQVFFI